METMIAYRLLNARTKPEFQEVPEPPDRRRLVGTKLNFDEASLNVSSFSTVSEEVCLIERLLPL